MLEKSHAPYFGIPYRLPACPKGTVPCIISSATCIFIALQNKAPVLQRINGAWFFTTLLQLCTSPLQTKPFLLLTTETVGKSPALPASVTGWQILVLSPTPPVDTGARNTAYVEGGWWPFPSWSPLLPCAAQLITESGVGWLNCTSFSVLGEALCFFWWGFLEVTGIGGFWLRKVDFVPVLVQKKAVVPCWGKLLVWQL